MIPIALSMLSVNQWNGQIPNNLRCHHCLVQPSIDMNGSFIAYIIYETLVWEFLDFMIIMKYVDNEYWYTPTDKIVMIEGK